MMIKNLTIAIVLNLLCVCAAVAQTTDTVNAPQTAATTFTYQGKLTDSSVPAAANYDFQFALFDLATGGVLQGSIIQKLNVPVASGIFTVTLDFGNQFPGADRFLDISVRPASVGVFTPLTPRQPITSTPYAVRSLSAATATVATTAGNATNAEQLNGRPAADYVLNTDSRLTDARSPTAGSANYIQNSPASAQSANFNITGNSTVGGNGLFTGNLTVNGAITANGGLDMTGKKITNLAAPTSLTDVANKSYVDAAAAAVVAKYAHSNWSTPQMSIASGAWANIPPSQFNYTTSGGALLINMNLVLKDGSHSTCQPLIDGQWAGTYGGLPDAGSPFWREGLQYTGDANFHRWNLSRIYPNIPAGPHTFIIQCATNGGVLQVCGGSLGCSWGVVELH